MGYSCRQSSQLPKTPEGGDGSRPKTYLCLIDCQGAKALDPWLAFNINGQGYRPGCYIVFYNVPEDSVLDQLALKRGIHGVFYLNDSIDLIPRGLKVIMGGQLWYRRDILMDAFRNPAPKAGNANHTVCGLTFRQREILRLVVSGTPNHNIAERLSISPNTVRSHVYNIYKKINVKNRLQAAMWARQNLGVGSG